MGTMGMAETGSYEKGAAAAGEQEALRVQPLEEEASPAAGSWARAVAALPPRGVYLLWLWLPRPLRLKVPAPGGTALEPGLYAYAGSAQRALPARLNRHVTGAGSRHWHVDHLRSAARVVGVDVWPGAPREAECLLAQRLAGSSRTVTRPRRFGSSDCRCAGHLVGLGRRPEAVPAYRAPRHLQGELLAVFRPAERPWNERRRQR